MCELFKGILYRFSLCHKLFHKQCFADIQFPEGRIHEDLSTTYQLFAKENKSVYACFGYWCVDQVYYILKQVEDKQEQKKYLKVIQATINMHYKELVNNQVLSFKYKYIVTILHYHIKLLLFSNQLKRVLFKG